MRSKYDPLLWITFKKSECPACAAAVLGLVDSGAAGILLHTGIGEAMDIVITSGEKILYSGSGCVIEGYKDTALMQARGG